MDQQRHEAAWCSQLVDDGWEDDRAAPIKHNVYIVMIRTLQQDTVTDQVYGNRRAAYDRCSSLLADPTLTSHEVVDTWVIIREVI